MWIKMIKAIKNWLNSPTWTKTKNGYEKATCGEIITE